MAVEERLSCRNLLAGADLSAYQYRFVYLSAAKTVSLLATTGGEAFGVLYNEPAASGRSAEVVRYGRCKVEAGAVVAAGADVSSDTVGRAITALNNYSINGKAITAAGAAGDIIEVELTDRGKSGLSMGYRVPGDVQTAAFTCAGNGTWENEDLVALLNAQTTTDITTSRAVHVFGVLEIITGNGVAHTVQWGDGGMVSGIDKVQQYVTPAASSSYFVPVDLMTDASGNIRILVDDITQVTFKFHLRGYQYVQNTAIS